MFYVFYKYIYIINRFSLTCTEYNIILAHKSADPVAKMFETTSLSTSFFCRDVLLVAGEAGLGAQLHGGSLLRTCNDEHIFKVHLCGGKQRSKEMST